MQQDAASLALRGYAPLTFTSILDPWLGAN